MMETYKVTVHIMLQAHPILHAMCRNTYQKGDMFCVLTDDDEVFKYPIANIFRVVEDYGEHISNRKDDE